MKDSWEFHQLEVYYGARFLSIILPELYQLPSNVVKNKSCLQVRFSDFFHFFVTKNDLKLILSFWKDFSLRVKKQPETSLKELISLRNRLEKLEIPGLLYRVNSAIHSEKMHSKVLIAIRVTRVLVKISNAEIEGLKRIFKRENRGFFVRKEANLMVKRLKKHPRSRIYLCTLKAEIGDLVSEIWDLPVAIVKKRREIWKICTNFDEKNTVFVGWKEGKVGEGERSMKRLERYLVRLLDDSDTDVGEYMSSHPFPRS